MRPRTNAVVLAGFPLCIEDIAINEVIIHREVGVPYLRPPILRGREPPSPAGGCLRPSVADGLVPTSSEVIASVVMVPKHPQPRHAIQPSPLVDAFEYVLPLSRVVSNTVCRRPTLGIDATPIEVVTHIDDVVRVADCCPPLHLSSHTLLCHVVNARDKLPVVGRELHRPVIRRPWRISDATPIADDENVVRTVRLDARVLQGDTVEVGCQGAWLWRSERVVACIAARKVAAILLWPQPKLLGL
mmetsp:Transcript_19186/g.48326  ORF Transcript_19186/g.48326 Transcript_19186/m.48326 type:complete len:244 (+) Transcript_19186:913-1644(+)